MTSRFKVKVQSKTHHHSSEQSSDWYGEHTESPVAAPKAPIHVVGSSPSRYETSEYPGKNRLLRIGDWDPLPEREKQPLTSTSLRESKHTKHAAERIQPKSKRHLDLLAKIDREIAGRPPSDFVAPLLSRDELERMRSIGDGRQIDSLQLVDRPPPLVGMVVKTKSRKRMVKQKSRKNVSEKLAKSKSKSKKRRASAPTGRHGERKPSRRIPKTKSAPPPRTKAKRKKEPFPIVLEEEVNSTPLTKDLLKENAKAVSNQSDLQGEVATAILARQQKEKFPLESLPGGTHRRAQWHSCYRGYFVRRLNEREIDILRISDGNMHQVWTGYFSDMGFHLDLIDIITVQSAIRRRKPREAFVRQRNAAIQIQAATRRWLAMGEIHARRKRQRKQMQRQRAHDLARRRSRRTKEHAAVRIQAVARGWVATRQVEILKEIQLIVKAERKSRQDKERAATMIQTAWRCYSTRIDFVGAYCSVIMIQTWTRKLLARRKVGYLQKRRQQQRRSVSRRKSRQRKERAAATAIQSCWRSYWCRNDFLDMFCAAMMIQTWTRQCQARRKVEQMRRVRQHHVQQQRSVSKRKSRQRKDRAATAIQSSWRGYSCRVRYIVMMLSAVRIQSAVRSHQAACEDDSMQRGATVIQALARGVAGRKQAERTKERKRKTAQKSAFAVASLRRRQRHASTLIQGAARRTKGRVEFKKQNSCATMIQSLVRRFLAVKKYRTTINAVIMVQSIARGFLTRFNLLINHYAASEIQRAWRLSRDRRWSSETRSRAIIRVQSQVRRMIAVKSFENLKRAMMQEESRSNDCSPVSFSSGEDKSQSKAELHAQLLAFESKRRSTYDPVLKESMLKWRASVDALQASVQEMVHAERLIFGSAVANHVLGEGMFEASDDGLSLVSEGTMSNGPNMLPLRRRKKQETGQNSSGNADAYMDVSDEMTRVREDLQAQVNALSEMGGIIIGELESAEMGVIEAWDSYDAVYMALSESGVSPPTEGLAERGGDLWLEEMRYCVAVAFQVLSWQRAISDLSNVFNNVSTTERKHRSRLRELLLVFASQRRQQVSTYSSMQAHDLQELVDHQVDQIHPQIEELIRETENRPFVDVPSNFMRVEASDFTTLDSPMTSTLLRGASILEMGVKGGFGRRTTWHRTLAITTTDRFVHFFDMQASSPDVSAPDDAFHELILMAQLQKLDGGEKGLFESLMPAESLFLRNCNTKMNPKEKRQFELREDQVAKKGKSRMSKLMLRTSSPEETDEWIESLGIQGR